MNDFWKKKNAVFVVSLETYYSKPLILDCPIKNIEIKLLSIFVLK